MRDAKMYVKKIFYFIDKKRMLFVGNVINHDAFVSHSCWKVLKNGLEIGTIKIINENFITNHFVDNEFLRVLEAPINADMQSLSPETQDIELVKIAENQ